MMESVWRLSETFPETLSQRKCSLLLPAEGLYGSVSSKLILRQRNPILAFNKLVHRECFLMVGDKEGKQQQMNIMTF